MRTVSIETETKRNSCNIEKKRFPLIFKDDNTIAPTWTTSPKGTNTFNVEARGSARELPQTINFPNVCEMNQNRYNKAEMTYRVIRNGTKSRIRGNIFFCSWFNFQLFFDSSNGLLGNYRRFQNPVPGGDRYHY